MDFVWKKTPPPNYHIFIFVAERFLYNQSRNAGAELFQNSLCILLVLLGVQGTT